MKIALLISAALFAVFMTYGFFASNTPEAKAQARERAAIELCWSEHDRKSLAPAEKRFIAGACEMMESDFVKKHRTRP